MFNLSSDIQTFHICQNNFSFLMFNWFHEYNKPKTEFNSPCLIYTFLVFTNSVSGTTIYSLAQFQNLEIFLAHSFIFSMCASTLSGQTIIICHLNYLKGLLTSLSSATIALPLQFMLCIKAYFFQNTVRHYSSTYNYPSLNFRNSSNYPSVNFRNSLNKI